MEQSEIDSLTAYLAKLFNEKELMVLLHPEDDDQALVAIGQSFFARIDKDVDEGETSYSFSKDIPDQPMDELRAYFKNIFNAQDVEVRARSNKQDSAEIYKGDEFLGVLYDDEGSQDGMQVFNMAILDIDLDMDDNAA